MDFPQFCVPLTQTDAVYLQHAIERASRFPPALRDRASISLSYLTQRLDATSLDRRGIVAAAYYGFYLLPANFPRWLDWVDRTRRIHAEDDPPRSDEGELLKQKALQDYAARGFGFADRHAIKRFYDDLDRFLSGPRSPFVSYESVVYTKQYIDHVVPARNSPLPRWYRWSEEERSTYANGPAFLWDFAMHAKSGQFPDVAIEVFEGWVLVACKQEDAVDVIAYFPHDMRIGAGERPGQATSFLDSFSAEDRERLEQHVEVGTLRRYVDYPEVVGALYEMAARRFPAASVNMVVEPTYIRLEEYSA